MVEKIPHCNICGRLIRSPRYQWRRGDGKAVVCLACLINPEWPRQAVREGKAYKKIPIMEEWKLFSSDNQFEGQRLLRIFNPDSNYTVIYDSSHRENCTCGRC